MLASLRRLSGLGAPTGTCRCPDAAFRGSNRRSVNNSARSPRTWRCRPTAPAETRGQMTAGVVAGALGAEARGVMGWLAKVAFGLWEQPGCQHQNVWQVQDMLMPDSEFNSKWRDRDWPSSGALRVSLSAFSPFLNLLHEYQLLPKLILSRTQTQTPNAAEISSAAHFHFILACFNKLPATVFKENFVTQDTNERKIYVTVGLGAQCCLPLLSAVLQACLSPYAKLTLRIKKPWKRGKGHMWICLYFEKRGDRVGSTKEVAHKETNDTLWKKRDPNWWE